MLRKKWIWCNLQLLAKFGWLAEISELHGEKHNYLEIVTIAQSRWLTKQQYQTDRQIVLPVTWTWECYTFRSMKKKSNNGRRIYDLPTVNGTNCSFTLHFLSCIVKLIEYFRATFACIDENMMQYLGWAFAGVNKDVINFFLGRYLRHLSSFQYLGLQWHVLHRNIPVMKITFIECNTLYEDLNVRIKYLDIWKYSLVFMNRTNTLVLVRSSFLNSLIS